MAIVLATLASGCLFGPTIDCAVSADLTRVDCDHAIQVALAQLPSDRTVTKVVVRPGCPRWMKCPASTIPLVISVEVAFAGTDRQAEIGVIRDQWKAGQVHYFPLEIPPSP